MLNWSLLEAEPYRALTAALSLPSFSYMFDPIELVIWGKLNLDDEFYRTWVVFGWSWMAVDCSS